MTPKALVFFDLDGTLLNASSQVEPEVIEALEKLKENNVIPFIATGRSPIEIQHVLEKTPIDSFITLNGQYIVYEGKEVYRSVIPKELLGELKQATDELNLALSFYTSDKIRATMGTEDLKNAYTYIHATVPPIDPNLFMEEEIMMALVLNSDTSKDTYFREKFPELSFYRNTPYSMDTIIHGNSKATAITELVKLMGFENIPTYAFGDGPNDMEMMDMADFGVAMGNGIPALKEKANYVAASHTEGGILDGLEHFNLLS